MGQERTGENHRQNEGNRDRDTVYGYKINDTNLNTLSGLLTEYLNSSRTGSFTQVDLTSFANFKQPSFRVK